MADVENTPLLQGSEPLAPSTVEYYRPAVNTILGISGAIGVWNLFRGDFWHALIYESVTILTAIGLLRDFPPSNVRMHGDIIKASIAYGLGPATIQTFALTVGGGVVLFGPLAGILYMLPPDGLTAIAQAVKEIWNHGGVIFGGEISDYLKGIQNLLIRLFADDFKLLSGTSIAQIGPAVSLYRQAKSLGQGFLDDELLIPRMIYKDDGSDATAVVAGLLRALSSVSLGLELYILAAYSFALRGFMQQHVKKLFLLNWPLQEVWAEDLPTIRGSAMALAIGTCASSIVLFIPYGKDYPLYAFIESCTFFGAHCVLELSFALDIADSLYSNRFLLQGDYKSALLGPVLISGTISFLSGLPWIVNSKTVFLALAEAIEKGRSSEVQVESIRTTLYRTDYLPTLAFIFFAYKAVTKIGRAKRFPNNIFV